MLYDAKIVTSRVRTKRCLRVCRGAAYPCGGLSLAKIIQAGLKIKLICLCRCAVSEKMPAGEKPGTGRFTPGEASGRQVRKNGGPRLFGPPKAGAGCDLLTKNNSSGGHPLPRSLLRSRHSRLPCRTAKRVNFSV